MKNLTVTKQKTRRYEPVGRCIYCGDNSSFDLTNEHIVPIGLGGGLLLPKASCKACAKITSKIETACLRGMLLPYRHAFGLVRNPRDIPKTTTVRIGPYRERREVKRDEAPSYLPVPELMDLPGILTGKGLGSPMRYRLLPFGNKDEFRESAAKLGGDVTVEITVDVDAYLRMLAKIAHGFAVAHLSLEGFDPELPDFILGKNPMLTSFLIGAAPSPHPPLAEPDSLPHQLFMSSYEWGAQRLIIMRIRMFAAHGTPAYTIVVGPSLLSPERLQAVGL